MLVAVKYNRCHIWDRTSYLGAEQSCHGKGWPCEKPPNNRRKPEKEMTRHVQISRFRRLQIYWPLAERKAKIPQKRMKWEKKLFAIVARLRPSPWPWRGPNQAKVTRADSNHWLVTTLKYPPAYSTGSSYWRPSPILIAKRHWVMSLCLLPSIQRDLKSKPWVVWPCPSLWVICIMVRLSPTI